MATKQAKTRYGISHRLVNMPPFRKHGFRVTFASHFDRKTPLQDGDQGVSKWIDHVCAVIFYRIPKEEKQQILEEVTACLNPYTTKTANGMPIIKD
jgi:hypothetical protein